MNFTISKCFQCFSNILYLNWPLHISFSWMVHFFKFLQVELSELDDFAQKVLQFLKKSVEKMYPNPVTQEDQVDLFEQGKQQYGWFFYYTEVHCCINQPLNSFNCYLNIFSFEHYFKNKNCSGCLYWTKPEI